MTRIIVRAVPARQDFVNYLVNTLPAYAEFSFDRTWEDAAFDNLTGSQRATRNFLNALDMASNDACIHMEDDAVLAEDFVAKAEATIAEHPKEVIQFFSRRGDDLVVGSRYDRTFANNVCFYLPEHYSALLAAYWRNEWSAKNPKHPSGWDLMMNDWLKSRREPYWIRCPSLADHRVSVSVIDPRRAKNRRSKSFDAPTAPVEIP